MVHEKSDDRRAPATVLPEDADASACAFSRGLSALPAPDVGDSELAVLWYDKTCTKTCETLSFTIPCAGVFEPPDEPPRCCCCNRWNASNAQQFAFVNFFTFAADDDPLLVRRSNNFRTISTDRVSVPTSRASQETQRRRLQRR